MSYYFFDFAVKGNGRSFSSYSRDLESSSFLLNKRFHQSYHYFFVLLGIRPVTLFFTIKNKLPLQPALKQAGMGMLTKLVNHYTHTALALLCQSIGGGFFSSLVKEYDAKDRYAYVYWARFFGLLRLPKAIAILLGVPPLDGDVEHFDRPLISPVAASEDAFKRYILYETSDLFINILFSNIIAPKLQLDRDLYAFDKASVKGKIVRSVCIMLGYEVGALVGRAVGNAIDQYRGVDNQNSNASGVDKSLAACFEFWFATIIAQIACPKGALLGYHLFPGQLYEYEVLALQQQDRSLLNA